MTKVNFDQALQVAHTVANQDFRTWLSMYTTSRDSGPYILTVGETAWHRHLVIRETFKDGDVLLGILPDSASPWDLLDLETQDVLLSELVVDGYTSVKRFLRPTVTVAS